MKVKKLLTMLLAVALVASFASFPAFADDGEPAPEVPFVHGIDYSSADTYDIAAAPALADLKIDLAAEKLYVPETFTVAAYSLDNGNKWKVGSIGAADGADISKLLNKGMTLVLTDKYDSKAKKPAAAIEATDTDPAVPAAVVYTFPAIETRPKMDKLVINYEIAADNNGTSNGEWVLSVKDGKTAVAAQGTTPLQIAPAAADKKTPEVTADGDSWGAFPSSGGIAIKDLGADKKTVKTVYLVRTAPVVAAKNIPASKPAKFTAQGVQKAPAFKADYKKELMKVKENAVVFFGNKETLVVPGATAVAYDVKTADPAGVLTLPFTKDAAKVGVNLAPYLTEARETVCVFIAANAKKPASAIQEYKLAARAYLPNAALTLNKGKIKDVKLKAHEMFNKEKSKWGGLPKVDKKVDIDIRTKATAKGGKEDAEGTFAASATGTLAIGWNVIDPTAKTPKSGIVSAVITAPNYPGVLVFTPTALAATYTVGDTPAIITFDITGMFPDMTGLSVSADTSNKDVIAGIDEAVVVDQKKVTVKLTTALAPGTTVITLVVPDTFFTTAGNEKYVKDLTYCIPVTITVEAAPAAPEPTEP